MAKDQACKLQILSAKHPDILQAVDGMYDKFYTPLQVHQMVMRKFHEDVGLTALRKYRQGHWKVFKDMVREQKAALKGIAEIIGEDGLDFGVNALLWQELQKMTPAQLMSFKKVLNDSAKVEVLKKQFALYAQEHRLKMKERREASDAAKLAAGEDEGIDDFDQAQKVVQQVKAIFGIGTRDLKPAVRPQLGPALDITPAVTG